MTTEELNVTAPEAPEAPAVPAPAGGPGKTAKKKRRPNKALRRIITTVIVLAVLAAIAFAVWYFVFREKEVVGDIVTAEAGISSIQSSVQGSGNARAGGSAAITVGADSVIREVLVAEGDMVFEGQPLYTAYSPDAEAQVETAKKAVAQAEKDLAAAQDAYNKLQGEASELTVRVPFDGKLQDVAEGLEVGKDLAAGTPIATLVNDRQLKLTLYFSYAYENDISVGQTVDVSVPALMLILQGKVEEIHKVNFISPEGGTYFEVDISLDNPGTLTAEMDASAIIRTASGAELYPYENGKLKFSGSTAVTAAQTGKIASIGDLRNYTSVSKGDVLLTQSAEDFNTQLSALAANVEAAQNSLTDAQEKLAAAEQNVTNLDAVAPISGSITSCAIAEGQEVAGGTTVITISDTTTMVVEITVDDRNIPFVTPGMNVDLSDWNGNTYIGTVTKINMEQSESGYSGLTSYPVTLSVDNMSGTLLQGMWLDYSFVTSESADCVTVPIQCVKSIVDTDGNPQTVVFLQAESAPENAVSFEPPEDDPYAYNTTKYPTPEEGYWPVPVETGLNDKYNVEIVSGLNAGDVVFSAYMMTGAWN